MVLLFFETPRYFIVLLHPLHFIQTTTKILMVDVVMRVVSMEVEVEVPLDNAITVIDIITLLINAISSTVFHRGISLSTLVRLTQLVLILLTTLHLIRILFQQQINFH